MSLYFHIKWVYKLTIFVCSLEWSNHHTTPCISCVRGTFCYMKPPNIHWEINVKSRRSLHKLYFFHILSQSTLLSITLSMWTFNTVSHEQHAQTVNLKPSTLYSRGRYLYPHQNVFLEQKRYHKQSLFARLWQNIQINLHSACNSNDKYYIKILHYICKRLLSNYPVEES
jgi:hypothetical protein